ncbi:hypothetical protein NP493_249g10018, partial [Ridgeia piscesae]
CRRKVFAVALFVIAARCNDALLFGNSESLRYFVVLYFVVLYLVVRYFVVRYFVVRYFVVRYFVVRYFVARYFVNATGSDMIPTHRCVARTGCSSSRRILNVAGASYTTYAHKPAFSAKR